VQVLRQIAERRGWQVAAKHSPSLMSAFGGKADMAMNGPNVCF
jgi:hypothetical protein